MAKGVKHYFKNGKEHKGATHKDAKGRVMSGKTHTASSKFLVHKNMKIKKSSPARRKSFRARHNCDQAKDKTTAKYWSCKAW